MTMKRESSLHTKIKKYAEGLGWYVVKVWGGGFQESGIPDLILCVNGVFIGMEVKIGTGKPSALQCDHVLSVCEAGGVGCIVWSFEEAKQIIDEVAVGDYDLQGYFDAATALYKKYVK